MPRCGGFGRCAAGLGDGIGMRNPPWLGPRGGRPVAGDAYNAGVKRVLTARLLGRDARALLVHVGPAGGEQLSWHDV